MKFLFLFFLPMLLFGLNCENLETEYEKKYFGCILSKEILMELDKYYYLQNSSVSEKEEVYAKHKEIYGNYFPPNIKNIKELKNNLIDDDRKINKIKNNKPNTFLPEITAKKRLINDQNKQNNEKSLKNKKTSKAFQYNPSEVPQVNEKMFKSMKEKNLEVFGKYEYLKGGELEIINYCKKENYSEEFCICYTKNYFKEFTANERNYLPIVLTNFDNFLTKKIKLNPKDSTSFNLRNKFFRFNAKTKQICQ